MTAQAPSAQAQEPLLGSASAFRHSGAEYGPDETSLSFPVRFRAGLLGAVLGVVGLALATAGGLAIVAGPFHTSLGSLG